MPSCTFLLRGAQLAQIVLLTAGVTDDKLKNATSTNSPFRPEMVNDQFYQLFDLKEEPRGQHEAILDWYQQCAQPCLDEEILQNVQQKNQPVMHGNANGQGFHVTLGPDTYTIEQKQLGSFKSAWRNFGRAAGSGYHFSYAIKQGSRLLYTAKSEDSYGKRWKVRPGSSKDAILSATHLDQFPTDTDYSRTIEYVFQVGDAKDPTDAGRLSHVQGDGQDIYDVTVYPGQDAGLILLTSLLIDTAADWVRIQQGKHMGVTEDKMQGGY